MPSPVFYPLVNGNRYDFSSLRIKINGNPVPIIGCTEISYADRLNPGIVRGTAPQKIGRTRGVHEPEASITLLKQEFQNLAELLGGDAGYGLTPFQIDVTMNDTGAPIINDTITGCRITGAEHSYSASADALVVTCPLDVMEIKLGGFRIAGQLVTA